MLSRLAMQVTLNLDVERILPDFIRRRFIVRKQTLYPNVKKGLFSRILRDDSTLGTITKGVVADVSSQVCFTIIYLDKTFFLRSLMTSDLIDTGDYYCKCLPIPLLHTICSVCYFSVDFITYAN